MKNKHIVLTGGGTAGHVTPNLALIEVLQAKGWSIDYIGSVDGIERKLIEEVKIPYHSIRSGKLRRYFSWKNFTDPVNVLIGIIQAYRLLRRLKPTLVFSKGGFIAFPVVFSAYLQKIPVVAHESDMTPGLANRLSYPFVSKLCVTFAASKRHMKQQEKVEVTGTPIRAALFDGDKLRGLTYCGFTTEKPCLLIIGGSLGSHAINQCIRDNLALLLERFQIIHICGSGNKDSTYADVPGYRQYEYVTAELPDLFAASALVITRAGANSVCELLALVKPHIFIPLPITASRGDQIANAAFFEKQGISLVIDQNALSKDTLFDAIDQVFVREPAILEAMRVLDAKSGTEKVIKVIESVNASMPY